MLGLFPVLYFLFPLFMRILHLDTGTTWRGGQQQICWLMEGLREHGDEQRLVAPARSPLGAKMQEKGFAVTLLRGAGVSLGNLLALRRVAHEFDIVHAHDSRGHTLAWFGGCAKGGRSRPLLVVSRRVGFPIGRFGSLKYASADAYIAVSDFCRRQLLNVHVDAKKVHVVFDGVEMPAPPAPGERREFRARFASRGASDAIQIIGTLTSIAPEKLLLEEIDLLAGLPPSVHLWVGRPAGPDAEISDAPLVEYAAQRGVQERFRVLPLSGELGGFFAALDVFLYLSKSEGLGSAILLAMAYGLPVVASRVGGIPEIVRDQQTGLLAGANETAALPRMVRSLLDSEELRRRLGTAARGFVSENATTEIMVSKTRAVYDELLKSPAGAGPAVVQRADIPVEQVESRTGGIA